MNLKVQELSFTLFAKDLKPAIVNPNILQYTGIIPGEWGLVENPIYSDRELKLVFDNQVRLTIQSSRIIFAETIGKKRIQNIQISQLISRYLQVFSKLEYQAFSISPGGYAAFNSDAEVSQYMSQNLLASNPWQLFEEKSIDTVGLKLAYPYKSGNFYLDINQANIEIDSQAVPAVWFSGNFNYQLVGKNNAEKLENLQTLIQQWKIDVSKFCNFVDKKFLASMVVPEMSLFPINN